MLAFRTSWVFAYIPLGISLGLALLDRMAVLILFFEEPHVHLLTGVHIKKNSSFSQDFARLVKFIDVLYKRTQTY